MKKFFWRSASRFSAAFQRSAKFAKFTEFDARELSRIVGPNGILTDPNDTTPYSTDWTRQFQGATAAVLKPKSTAEVAAILRHCNDRNLAVVPQGGNTGLVGGGVPLFDEIVLSTSRMNEIRAIDATTGIVVCEAGCVLERLDARLAEHGYAAPVDLGSRGSCQIGGNVATNAGGTRLVRYGSLRGTVLGLEVVKADGTVLDFMTSLRKDNTGFDLKQLFIGSEGTLGVITGVSFLAVQRSVTVDVAYLACSSFNDAIEVYRRSRRRLGEVLSACEFMDGEAMRLVNTHLGLENPFLGRPNYPFYVLVETAGSAGSNSSSQLETFLEDLFEEKLVCDGILAADGRQATALWALRERIAEALRIDGYVHKYDLSLPLSQLYELVEAMRKRTGGIAKSVVGYGHLGDGNLHLNLTSDENSEQLANVIEPFVYEWTASRRGSVSAEHGLGLMKAHCISYSKSPEAIRMMIDLKRMLDPKGILNPYKTLPMY